MSVTSIICFGTDRNEVHSWGKKIQRECEKRGADMYGPAPLPPVSIVWDGEEYNVQPENVEHSEDFWFDDIQLSGEEEDELYPEPNRLRNIVSGRAITIENDEVAASALDTEIGDGLFVRVDVQKADIPESSGSHSMGYDPAKDYVTDVDYEANHR